MVKIEERAKLRRLGRSNGFHPENPGPRREAKASIDKNAHVGKKKNGLPEKCKKIEGTERGGKIIRASTAKQTLKP